MFDLSNAANFNSKPSIKYLTSTAQNIQAYQNQSIQKLAQPIGIEKYLITESSTVSPGIAGTEK